MITVSAALDRAASGSIAGGSIVAAGDGWHVSVRDAGRWRVICLARDRFRARKFGSLAAAAEILRRLGVNECQLELQRRDDRQLELDAV
jgi:hypothetical protein